jgi:hypothetical protein
MNNYDNKKVYNKGNQKKARRKALNIERQYILNQFINNTIYNDILEY